MQVFNKTTTAFVYKLKCGKYYKHDSRGSWSASIHGVSKRDVTTDSIEHATQHPNPLDGPPYLARFMLGGEWLKVNIKVSISIEE